MWQEERWLSKSRVVTFPGLVPWPTDWEHICLHCRASNNFSVSGARWGLILHRLHRIQGYPSIPRGRGSYSDDDVYSLLMQHQRNEAYLGVVSSSFLCLQTCIRRCLKTCSSLRRPQLLECPQESLRSWGMARSRGLDGTPSEEPSCKPQLILLYCHVIFIQLSPATGPEMLSFWILMWALSARIFSF